ncbi:Cytochrome c-555 [BD1-7 clade bacterium]|uniref:Cytochrome c-555 n=1 Tax=BD1-7 clade bacterium TaxID=2029982 RepID=A0A5S9MS25_9GAMM|nr:Cytochrome c-555 [BD1-7 clade bacterium]CAA0081505.1 Cytochrome c-555 [BD1-7 clade bacterium]CAA0083235.1 Cytochrome c-555 [BD1-7 clade bacterium]
MKSATLVLKSAILLVLSTLMASQSFALSEEREAAMIERIKPVGTICLEGDGCAAAKVVANAEPRTGKEIYDGKCVACHASGAAGAPKLGDAAAWTARIAQGNDALYSNAINGINGMPAKGLCMDCSDDEIKATVDYMVENSK